MALSDPAWAQAISIGKVQLNNKISKMEEAFAWLIPSAGQGPPSPTFSFLFIFFARRLLRMQVMYLEKGSQAAIRLDREDGWTAAKWRIMLMFVLIIKCGGINLYVNR